VTVIGAVTAGAALGFLPWNFPKARFFMGAVGSYFSGGWLAASTIVGVQLGVPPFAMLAPLLSAPIVLHHHPSP
jgi:UDP-N-acetylmuramyl pentapeptide phosphotransferase/UDP-N-acetylglucosamine-1-phosphate transferase